MSKGAYYDARETRKPAAREKDLFDRLPGQIAGAVAKAPGWARQLEGFDTGAITSREALAALPILRKSALKDLQSNDPPFGGFATGGYDVLGRVFMSPGPIIEPESRASDWWSLARALFAAGGRKGDLVHNSFAYHMTPAGHMFENGAFALGCTVFPAGTGNTDQQVEAIGRLRPRGYTGTPDFLKVLLDRAAEASLDVSCLEYGLVSGAALPGSLREDLSKRSINVVQCYGTADLGIVAYESQARDGLIVNEDLIVEIVVPGTGDPVAEGEVGEIVVTRMAQDYPLIRFATGDLSAVLADLSPCGRTNMRLKGWLGRADQTTKVKGMFVHPEQVADVVQRHKEIDRVRFVVTRKNEQDVLIIRAESGSEDDTLSKSVADSVQAVCKVRGDVEIVAPGSLPRDGIVIADERDYD